MRRLPIKKQKRSLGSRSYWSSKREKQNRGKMKTVGKPSLSVNSCGVVTAHEEPEPFPSSRPRACHQMRTLRSLQWPVCHTQALHTVGATLLLNLNHSWTCLNQVRGRTKDLEGSRSFPRQGFQQVHGGWVITAGSNLGLPPPACVSFRFLLCGARMTWPAGPASPGCCQGQTGRLNALCKR